MTVNTENGVYLFWTQAAHADEEWTMLGGFVIDCFADPETGELLVNVVEYWRRQIRYHTFPVGEAVHGLSGPNVRKDLIKHFLIQLAEIEGQQKDPFKHLKARNALTAACMTPDAAA